MKKIYSLLLAVCLFGFAACDKDNTTDPGQNGTPVFPESVARTITTEEGTSFSFTPNMAWTLSIPEEQDMMRYFKVIINNEELIGYSRSGEADTTLEIEVSGRTEDFENSHTLTMTLTMGGESHEVAEIELMKTGSLIEVYMAKLAAGGNAFLVEDGKFVYSDTVLEDGAEIGLYDHFKNHLKVSANRNWKATAPKWLTLSQEGGERGKIVEVNIASSDEIRPFEDEDGELLFFVDEQTPLASYTVHIDGCANEFDYSIVNASNAVVAAEAGTTTGSVTAAYGSQVFFAVPGETEWIKFSEGKGFGDNVWSDEEKSAGLHTKSFTAEFEDNMDEENTRKAYLFCLPLAETSLKPEDALTAEGTVADAFRKYLIASYTQQRYVAPREPDKLFVESMIGMDDSSTAGQELFALLQEYSDKSDYPTDQWYSEAVKDMPALYKLTLKDLKYGDGAILKIENQDDYTVYCHEEDMESGASTWINRFGKSTDGYYAFSFKWEGETDEDGTLKDPNSVTWIQPKHPQAYVVFKSEGVTVGALIVEIDAEELNIPLYNASIGNTDVGFTVMTPDKFGYSEKYSSVPQYRVNGYKAGQRDSEGSLNANALLLTFNNAYQPEYKNFVYEAVEEGLLSGKLDWCEGRWVGGFSNGHMAYFDRESGEEVELSDYVFGSDEPNVTGKDSNLQVTYLFGNSGPNQFRILCHNKSNELICTVYIYQYDSTTYDE